MEEVHPAPFTGAHSTTPDARLWQGILHAAQMLVQETDLRETLAAIVGNVRHCLPLDRVGIFYYDRDAAELTRLVGIGREGELEYEPASPVAVRPSDGGPLRQVVRGELPYFYSPDVRLDVPDVRFVEPIRAHAIVPLVAGGKIIGALAVDNLLSDRDIPEGLMQPLCLFGHFAAIALCNALRREELAQAEAQKKQFYRDVVYAVTNGKLVLCEPGDVEEHWAPPVEEVPIYREEDIRSVRQLVHDVCEAAGMDDQRIYDLGLCASEAATNALKHGEGGLAAIARLGELVRVRIEDRGAGIDPATLPKATLMKGFSTRASMGLGFTIMHELADKIYLSSAPCGTVVIIEMGVRRPEMAGLPLALLNWEE